MNSDYNNIVARRTNILYIALVLIGVVVIGRLFILQVIRHDQYADLALSAHEAKFSIPSQRGVIYARDGDGRTPLVLNEVLSTVYIDPQGIDDDDNEEIADKLVELLGAKVDRAEVLEKLGRNDSRYQVVAKEVDFDTTRLVEEAELNGVGLTEESYRVYPQGSLASQSVGFVNNEGLGQYGIEEYLDRQLSGTDGRFEAVTDAYGIPLATSEENIIEAPVNGNDIVLTIDANVQQAVEQILEEGVKSSKSESGSAIVMDPNTGAVLAMANYPTYSLSEYRQQEDYSVFTNSVVSSPYETGSGMKVLTMAAAINEGVVNKDTTYFDAGSVSVDGTKISNAAGGYGRIDMSTVVQKSVNTGVIFALEQFGDGNVNLQARNALYEYFTGSYGFGGVTGIEQANEAGGVVFGPEEGSGLNVRYANMTFGQGMTVTMLQMAAAMSAVANGGDYYQPHLVHATIDGDGNEVLTEPEMLRSILGESAAADVRAMMEGVAKSPGLGLGARAGYTIGGKTGTAQAIDQATGEYSEDEEIGSYIGFGGAEQAEYVIMTRVDKPKISGYAGTVAAGPIFTEISNFMIDYYQIPPKNGAN